MASTLPRRCFFETWKSISLCGACLAAVIPAAGPAVAGGIHKNQGDARDPEHAPLGSFASRTHHPGDARARTPGTAKQPGELQCNGYFAVSFFFWLWCSSRQHNAPKPEEHQFSMTRTRTRRICLPYDLEPRTDDQRPNDAPEATEENLHSPR